MDYAEGVCLWCWGGGGRGRGGKGREVDFEGDVSEGGALGVEEFLGDGVVEGEVI